MTWPAGSEWERPGAGGGGGGGTPARVDPDSYDILVWHDWDGTLPWASSGTNALELDAKVGDVLRGSLVWPNRARGSRSASRLPRWRARSSR